MQLTIDAGTLILVADILKAERGLTYQPVDEARRAIVASVNRLQAAGAELEEEFEEEDGEE